MTPDYTHRIAEENYWRLHGAAGYRVLTRTMIALKLAKTNGKPAQEKENEKKNRGLHCI